MSFDGWREVRLGDTCEVNENSLSNRIDWGYINYLETGNIKENKIELIHYIDLKVDKVPSRAKRIVQKNEVIYSTVRPNQRHYGIIKKPVPKMVVSTGFAVLRGIKDLLDNSFLYYYLAQDAVIDTLQAIAENSTSAYPSIKPSDIQSLKCQLPPINEQKAIAATLSCLDEMIELNNRINKTLEDMAQAIFKSWFVDFEPFQDGEFVDSELGPIPKGWRVVELKDVFRFTKGKKPNLLCNTKSDIKHKKYLTIDALNGGNAEYATNENVVLADTLDILMVMDGASSGTLYYGMNGIVASTIAKLDFSDDNLADFTYHFLKHNETEIKSHNTGSAIPHADKNYILRFKVAIPQKNEIKATSILFLNIRTIILQNRKSNLILSAIRDALLPKLMSGEIRVPLKEAN